MTSSLHVALAQDSGVLRADGPHPQRGDKLALFGQFVGSWEVEIVQHRPDGTHETIAGEWHFFWALEGRAVQDVWIAPRRSQRPRDRDLPGDYGTTVRFFDDEINAWRSTWIGPMRGLVLPFIGRQIGDEIVLEGTFEDGLLTRWIFSDITPAAFRWRAIESGDGGKSWALLQEMTARRLR